MLVTALVLGGCASADHGEQPVACRFAAVHEVTAASGSRFHDLAAVAQADGALVLWSDGSGASVRALDADGAPAGDARRLGPPCEAGIAAVADGHDVIWACGRRGDPDRGRSGAVTVRALDGSVSRHLGPLGPASFGVALTVREDQSAIVGWQHGAPFVSEAWEAVGGDPPVRLSRDGVHASAPAYAGRYTLWSEGWTGPDGEPLAEVRLRDEVDVQGSLALGTLDPRPALAIDGDGPPLLTLRDDRGRHGLRALVGRADAEGRFADEDLESPSPANADDSRPQLLVCSGVHLSVSTRHMNRGRVAVVAFRFDPASLEPLGQPHLIYRYHVELRQVRAACVDEQPLLLVASRGQGRPARLRAYRLACGPGVSYQRSPPALDADGW